MNGIRTGKMRLWFHETSSISLAQHSTPSVSATHAVAAEARNLYARDTYLSLGSALWLNTISLTRLSAQPEVNVSRLAGVRVVRRPGDIRDLMNSAGRRDAELVIHISWLVVPERI